MTDHLSPASLNLLVDRQLSAEQLATATEHLAVCQSCAAALLLVSVTIAAIQRNLQSTANASGSPAIVSGADLPQISPSARATTPN